MDNSNNNNFSINVLTIDDHPLFSTGISLLLDTIDARYQCHNATHINAALQFIANIELSLILLDLNLNHQHWSENIKYIQQVNRRKTPIAIISSSDDSRTIRATMETGIQGFIPKSSSTDILLAAINLIIAGGIFVPAQITSPKTVQHHPEITILNQRLSKRQKEILKLAVKGKAYKIIAEELHLSESTIKSHLSNAYRVLNVKNRIQAMQLLEDIRLFR